MRIEIKNDLFDISARLKEIDKDYTIVFNTENQKFEVLKNGTIALILPFENLDERTIRHVYYTRWDNFEKVLEDIERENRALEERNKKSIADKMENSVSRAFRVYGA